MLRVLFAGDRLFMKFADFDYFRDRLAAIDAAALREEEFSKEELAEAFRTADAIAIIAYPVDAALIETLENCKLIQTLSVGYDSVDLSAATAKGIPVCNTPTYCTDEVATHAVSLLTAVARKLHLALPRTRKAQWGYEFARPVHSLHGRTLGIVGFGRVGRALVPKARGLGLSVSAYDPYLDDDLFEQYGVTRCYELADLLAASDFVSLHAPLTPETHHLIDERALSLMRREAVLINTARGGLVDTDALVSALGDEQLAGAGIDVLEVEPPPDDYPLLSCPTALVTPHIAWYSEESHRQNQILAMDEVERVLGGKRPRHIANPQVLWKRR